MILSADDFNALKQGMRELGMIPNRELVLTYYDKTNDEIDGLTLGRIDQLAHEDWLKIQERKRNQQRYLNSFLARVAGTIASDYLAGRRRY